MSVDINGLLRERENLNCFLENQLWIVFEKGGRMTPIVTYRHAFKVVSSTFSHKFSNNVKF